jgi:ubiquitin-like-conjugating enzyme ATG10
MAHQDEYRQWPFLAEEEFELACAYFDQRYIQASLGPTRKLLQISHKRVATTGASYIEIIRVINVPDDVEDLSSFFAKLNAGAKTTTTVSSHEMEVEMTDEENDHVSNFNIITYRAPLIDLFRKLCDPSSQPMHQRHLQPTTRNLSSPM